MQQIADGWTSIVLYGYADFSEPTRARDGLMIFVDKANGWKQALNLGSGVLE
jgi:hypothetical protein